MAASAGGRGVSRLVRRIRDALRHRHAVDPVAGGRRGQAVGILRAELASLREDPERLARPLGSLTAHADRLLDSERLRLAELAALAAVPRARLRSGLLTLEGRPARRLGVRRHAIGSQVALPVAPWIGVERCVTLSPAVGDLWDRLLASEASCTDAVLRGEPGTVLEVDRAWVSRGDVLRMSMDPSAAGPQAPAGEQGMTLDVAVVPRFSYDFPPRKIRNFGHWLLDCVPHVAELAALAPDATYLLPPPYRDVHWEALALVGVSRERVVAWDGSRASCRRLLVQETDGRIGRGRPLASLLALRRRLLATVDDARPHRRVYVSRRDAKPDRQWLDNPDAVEAVFRERDFEILTMRDCTLAEQVEIFREARVVAGISGAGLAGILFSRPGTHVIDLLTDSLIEWYADERGTRSAWAQGRLPAGAPLNELSDSPRFYAHLAAVGEQTCHTFVGGDTLPVDRLGAFVDDVLSRDEGPPCLQ
jgi:hypothetical protein